MCLPHFQSFKPFAYVWSRVASLLFATNLLAGMTQNLEFFKYFSLITLSDTGPIIIGQGYAVNFIILAGVALVLYMIGMKVFKENDLPL